MTQTARSNLLWATLVIEELLRSGVDLFCVAPGSRSTPLVAALARNERARKLVHFDERGTAFAALGYARATGRPAAWVTTSGTAVANGFPAVVEAATDCVPMVLLTADRPPELRETGANQTIVQPNIFGSYVRWSFDLPAPDASVDPASVLTTVDQAVYRARRVPQGPVHLNLMFREPFLPDPDAPADPLPAPERWRRSPEPYTRYARTEPSADTADVERVAGALRERRRGLVVVGRMRARRDGEAAVRLGEALGWPVLPDAGSQVRTGCRSRNLVPFYDALLADGDFAESHAPEAVVWLGEGAVSKRLQRFLADYRPDPHVVVR
ncbi:MAG: 2-succinyl-5-enolpyruvyl-6-hydroxy-3-cyclohexene-1-carboxylic-acid synthase, partial [Actinomycetota bacterium]